METVKFAIIGCGRIAPKHAEAIKAIENAELIAVCDSDSEKAKIFSEKYKCKSYTNHKDLLAGESEINVISICTPHGFHAQIAIDSANAKKHVVTEKPMAMNLEEADDMIKACKENGVKLFVVKQNRYNEPIQKLKEAIEKGRFGKLFYGNANVYWSRPQEYYDQDPWRGTKAIDGGVLMNQASHHIDMLLWLMGEAVSVKATTQTMTHDIESEDLGIIIIKFKNGAYGSIVATTSVYPHNIEGSVTVMGTKGSAKVGGVALNKMELWKFEDWNNDDELIAKSSENPPNVYGFGHLNYLKDVVKSIVKNSDPKINGEDGRKTLELITRIYEAAKTGKEIEL